VKWPDTTDPKWLIGVRERAKYLKEETDYFVSARMVMSHGIYQMACDLRNMDQFMMDMALDKKFAGAVMERVTDTIVGLCKVYMEEAGEYFDMIELPGDDYGANENLVMSPRMFRQQVKPHIKRIVDTIREYKPDIKIMLHSDGMIAPLMEDMIELGIDVIHPLEPLPSMNLPEIKEKYGNRLSFLGAIDISHAMPGTVEDVVAEAKLRISQLAPGGGFILAPSNHMQADVPLENVIALYETARKFGTYPINI
jgi:uroporphyrinogen decarboxylase